MPFEFFNLHHYVQDGGSDGTMTSKSVAAATLPEHRPAFAALVVRCLLPRLKKRSGRYAPLRSAALAWIGRLDASEIVPLIHSVIGPLAGTSTCHSLVHVSFTRPRVIHSSTCRSLVHVSFTRPRVTRLFAQLKSRA